MRTQSKHIQTALRLASDWLREWCGFSRPITEQSKQLQCTLRLFQQSIENFSRTYILKCDPLDDVIPEKSCCCSSASMEEL